VREQSKNSVPSFAMAPSRGVLFISTALLLSSLLSFSFTYPGSIFGPPRISVDVPLLENLKEFYSRPEDLEIALHPEDHVSREPKTLNLTWNITRGSRSPDGVKKLVYLINGIVRECPFLLRV
jgi:hypothetical protein